MNMLQWRDPRLERAWQRRWAAENAGLDAATSLQTMLFPSLMARTVRRRRRRRRRCRRLPMPPAPKLHACLPGSSRVFLHAWATACSQATCVAIPARMPCRPGAACPWSPQAARHHPLRPLQLWDHVRGGSSQLRSLELLWLLTFLAWAPLLLWLSQRRPAAYARLRTPLVLLSRLHRQLTSERARRQPAPLPAACVSREHAACAGDACWPLPPCRQCGPWGLRLDPPTPPTHPLLFPSLLLSPAAVMHWSALFSREAMAASDSRGAAAWPTAVEGKLGLLLWRVRPVAAAPGRCTPPVLDWLLHAARACAAGCLDGGAAAPGPPHTRAPPADGPRTRLPAACSPAAWSRCSAPTYSPSSTLRPAPPCCWRPRCTARRGSAAWSAGARGRRRRRSCTLVGGRAAAEGEGGRVGLQAAGSGVRCQPGCGPACWPGPPLLPWPSGEGTVPGPYLVYSSPSHPTFLPQAWRSCCGAGCPGGAASPTCRRSPRQLAAAACAPRAAAGPAASRCTPGQRPPWARCCRWR